MLIAELLGEMDALLNRVATLAPALDAASARLTASAQTMAASADRYRETTQAIVDHSQKSAVSHIVRRTNEVAQASLEEQTEAMKVAARSAFETEATSQLLSATSHLRDLGVALDRKLKQAATPVWPKWFSHVATALISAGATTAVLLYAPRYLT